jgi:hypothetical protein
LLKAAERGKKFHEIIQEFVQTGNHPPFVDLVVKNNLNSLDKRVHETINFLKKNKSLNLTYYLGNEKLHYIFYKGELLATYVDLEFKDYIIELKTSNIKSSKSLLALLIFEVQLLIQYLCTGKDIYLLWSTGEGLIFNKFQVSSYSLKLLDMLIDLVHNKDDYSPTVKKTIIQEVIKKYSPPKILIH